MIAERTLPEFTRSEFSSRTAEELEGLRESLREGTHGQVNQIGLELEDSTVRVTGTSPSYYARQLATHTLQSCRPDLEIDNRICVVRG